MTGKTLSVSVGGACPPPAQVSLNAVPTALVRLLSQSFHPVTVLLMGALPRVLIKGQEWPKQVPGKQVWPALSITPENNSSLRKLCKPME